ncbi:hemolysin family protein [Microvirga sp. VF16]|uniref:hemolysin family protein n=1 Tax=Microvirga sp. VF16 TaxID=2807101 RepID=UPI00193D6398|nr:hemolysin family protein [Microvirga sp. VF16]QRM29591.1 HlyC/CorC family transporter [Microvirga sp. VF16]
MNEDRSRSDRPVRPLTETDDTRDHWYDRVLTRLGLKPRESIRHDLEDVLAETVEDTDFSPQERAMLKNVLSFHRIRVEDVMVPRADIVAVAADTNLGELLSLFRTAGHSRLPVYGETLDDPKGMVHIRDFLDFIAMRADGGASESGSSDEAPLPSLGQIDLSMALSSANILRPVLFVPRSMPAIDLLVRMQATRTHMALVIDEYGGTDGLVSIEDLVEMVVGDIEDEHDEDSTLTIVPAADGTYIADARASLDEVKDVLGLDLTDEEGAEDIDTIGGFIVTLAGRVPSRSEVIEGPSGLEFEVLDADPRRVKRLRVHRRTFALETETGESQATAPRPESAAAE